MTQSIENLVGEDEILRQRELPCWQETLRPLVDTKKFNEIESAVGEEVSESETIGFIAGFKLASRLWTESLK